MKRLSLSFFLLVLFGLLSFNANTLANEVNPEAAGTYIISINYIGNCGETNPKLDQVRAQGTDLTVNFNLFPAGCQVE